LKYVITKSSIESAKRAGLPQGFPGDQRQRDAEEGDDLVGAEIHRRLLEMAVEPDEARAHRDDDVGDVEQDVRSESSRSRGTSS
jgi:hypothetical protein